MGRGVLGAQDIWTDTTAALGNTASAPSTVHFRLWPKREAV
jgi:hypothetical protein